MKKSVGVALHAAKPAGKSRRLQAFSGSQDCLSIRDFGSRYGLSQETLTRMTGFSLRAVSNWTRGAKPSTATSRRFTETQRLFAALERLVSTEVIGAWLKQSNRAFDGSTPLQVIERGETDRIWRMIYELESGEPA
jgi:hypothetical protein